MENEFFFSYLSFEDVGTSCIVKLGEKNNQGFPQKDDSEREKDDMHSLKLFVKSYFESITEGVNDIILRVEEIGRRQSELEIRMKKLELFSETTADELLGYYIEILGDTSKDPVEIRSKYIDGLGRNNVIVLMKKIGKYLSAQNAVDDTMKDKIAFVINVLEKGEIEHKNSTTP